MSRSSHVASKPCQLRVQHFARHWSTVKPIAAAKCSSRPKLSSTVGVTAARRVRRRWSQSPRTCGDGGLGQVEKSRSTAATAGALARLFAFGGSTGGSMVVRVTPVSPVAVPFVTRPLPVVSPLSAGSVTGDNLSSVVASDPRRIAEAFSWYWRVIPGFPPMELPTTDSQPASINVCSTRLALRSLIDARTATFPTDGKRLAPSSFAQSHMASSTSLGDAGRSSFQAAVIREMLMGQTAIGYVWPGATAHQVHALRPLTLHSFLGPRHTKPSSASSGKRRASM